MKTLTPNLIVEDIETCLPFWIDRLGFKQTVEVPAGDRLGFVILERDAVRVMLQTRASLSEDVPPLAQGAYRTVLYLDVPDLAPYREKLAGLVPVVPERTTFYGAHEIIVTDPAGNVIFFAAH